MKVGNLVKPNLRIRNMRYFKGLVGVVVKVCDSAEPHCYIQWSGKCKLATLGDEDGVEIPVLTACRYVEVIA